MMMPALQKQYVARSELVIDAVLGDAPFALFYIHEIMYLHYTVCVTAFDMLIVVAGLDYSLFLPVQIVK